MIDEMYVEKPEGKPVKKFKARIDQTEREELFL